MDSTPDENAGTTPDVFRPSWVRAALAAVVAVGAFFIPQEIPLEYYPLNDPSSGLRYLEITCAADRASEVWIFLHTNKGFLDIEKIAWPIGPSEMAFTYTFPLADNPLRGFRLFPLGQPGELRITNFRLINRRGEELRRFTRNDFSARWGVAAIEPTDTGWKMVTEGDKGSWAEIDFGHYTMAEGMNVRNLQRCLLSTSYLTMMLWIILLAVFFAFRRPEPWRTTAHRMAFLVLLAALFSFVGNRGLIRNSIRSAQFEPPPRSDALTLEMDVNAPERGFAELFSDVGAGFAEGTQARATFESTTGVQTLRFPLPDKTLHGLRFDPIDLAGQLTIRRVRVTDGNGDVRATFPVDSFEAVQQVDEPEVAEEERLVVRTAADATDPVLKLKPEVLARINEQRMPGDLAR